MKFQSKIDAWVVALMVLAAAVMLRASYSAAASGAGGGVPVPVMVVGFAAGVVLPLWILLASYYVVDGGNLLIRSGPFRWTLPLAGITRVVRTRSMLSGPALSLDRLLIEYGAGNAVLVSPRDQDGFMRAIDQAADRSS